MSGVVAFVIVSAISAMAYGEDPLWYRGFFDGAMQVEGNGPAPGYHYTPSSGSTYPLNEWQYSAALPCDSCGHYHRANAYCPYCGRVCSGNGSHVRSDDVYQPYGMLPGAYFYERQPHFNFRSPINAGWPFLKYDQRW